MTHIFKPENMNKLDSDERRKSLPPEKVLNFMNIQPNDKLLDIGTGIGYFAIPALKYVGNEGKVIAIDLSKDMLDELQKRLPENTQNIETVLCDADKIILNEKNINKVLMAFVFHEIENKTDYLNQLKQYLVKNGEITIVEWVKTETPKGPPLNDRISYEELQEFAKKSDYSITEYENINEFNYLCKLKND